MNQRRYSLVCSHPLECLFSSLLLGLELRMGRPYWGLILRKGLMAGRSMWAGGLLRFLPRIILGSLCLLGPMGWLIRGRNRRCRSINIIIGLRLRLTFLSWKLKSYRRRYSNISGALTSPKPMSWEKPYTKTCRNRKTKANTNDFARYQSYYQAYKTSAKSAAC